MSDLIETITKNPVALFTDDAAYSEFYKRVEAEVSAHVPDLSTVRGRADIASLAFKVTKSKTAIDAAGKKLNEDARAKINLVDAQRRKIRDELDALATKVRQPLTEWEEAEKERAEKAKRIRDNVIGLGNSSPHERAQDIRNRIDELAEIVLSGEILGDDYDLAVADRNASIAYLQNHLERAVKAEEDAAELARLRAEKEERDRVDAARAEKERAEKEAIERQKEEQDRRAKADAEYKANVEREAEKARQAEIAKAKAEQERVEREAAERVEKAEKAAREAHDKAERDRVEREAEAKRLADEQAARDADRAHRGKVMGAAKSAMMELGADEDTAKKIVLAIVAGEIPNTRITF